MDVFLSRPNWVADEYAAGLELFLSKLRDLRLNPRTIGKTDFPVKSPLDEVIRVMGECRGAIILGYPQIHMAEGTIKGQEIHTHIFLPTEWNHIEAGLAYAKKLPLLVAHHSGIGRGIFDRGALNSFIFEKDFSKADWSAHEDIAGALRAWRDSVLNARPENREPTNKTAQHIALHKDEPWTIVGVGRKINSSKPLASNYKESAEASIEEITEHYVVIKQWSTGQRITIPLLDVIVSRDNERNRPMLEVRSKR